MNKIGRPPSILLPKPWEDLLARSQDRHERACLRKFMASCVAARIDPNWVSDTSLLAYEAWATLNKVPRPRQSVREAALVWNSMKERFADWPGARLTVPNNMGWQSCRPEDLPQSFNDDLMAFLDRASAQDIFDDEAPIAPLSPVTRRDRTGKIYQLATHALNRSIDASRLTSLADLVTPEIYDPIVRSLWDKANKKPNAHAQNLVRVLSLIARHWAKAPQDIIQKLKDVERRMRPAERGMTEKNWKRLRPFTVPATTGKLINLPQTIIHNLDPASPRLSDALLVQSSLAVSIELVAPVRVKNLAGMDLSRHFHWVGQNECYLVISNIRCRPAPCSSFGSISPPIARSCWGSPRIIKSCSSHAMAPRSARNSSAPRSRCFWKNIWACGSTSICSGIWQLICFCEPIRESMSPSDSSWAISLLPPRLPSIQALSSSTPTSATMPF